MLIHKKRGEQNLDGCEIWCDRFTIGKAGIRAGQAWLGSGAKPPDDPSTEIPDIFRTFMLQVDLFANSGEMTPFRNLRKVKDHATVWLSPICSSFVWQSSSRTVRYQDPEGDLSYNDNGSGGFYARQKAHQVSSIESLSNLTKWQQR